MADLVADMLGKSNSLTRADAARSADQKLRERDGYLADVLAKGTRVSLTVARGDQVPRPPGILITSHAREIPRRALPRIPSPRLTPMARRRQVTPWPTPPRPLLPDQPGLRFL